jgi:hypothetical protein
VRNAEFVEDVRIATGNVCDDELGASDATQDISHDLVASEEFIGATTAETDFLELKGAHDGLVNRRELRLEWDAAAGLAPAGS